MFNLQALNELSCKASTGMGGTMFSKAGAMIAFTGNVKFDKVLLGPQGNLAQAAIGQVLRRMSGENMPLMKVTAQGNAEVYFANLAEHVTVVNLEPGMELKVESENLLAFTDNVQYGVTILAQGVISQKGLATSTLKGTTQGAQAAILTEGNPIVLNTPCYADPDALVAWTGPNPGIKTQLSWKNLAGQASGESYFFEFKQSGHQVIIQPSERKSGIDLSIDSGDSADTQNNSLFGEGGNSLLNGLGQGGTGQGVGGIIGTIGNMLGR